MERDNQMVKAMIMRSAGINCNDETELGLKMAGAETEQVHVNQLVSGEKKLADFDILVIPGGFSYGDYIAAGTILANQIATKLKSQLSEFVEQGKVVVGICNGFQVLVKTGFLPGDGMKASLKNNKSGRFECRWVKLKKSSSNELVDQLEEFNVPIAHGEGQFVASDEVVEQLEVNGQILFKYSASEYPENPNGSVNDIAGISNKQGNVIGLMPHPERHLIPENHPEWTRQKPNKGEGLRFFKNIVRYCEK